MCTAFIRHGSQACLSLRVSVTVSMFITAVCCPRTPEKLREAGRSRKGLSALFLFILRRHLKQHHILMLTCVGKASEEAQYHVHSTTSLFSSEIL